MLTTALPRELISCVLEPNLLSPSIKNEKLRTALRYCKACSTRLLSKLPPARSMAVARESEMMPRAKMEVRRSYEMTRRIRTSMVVSVCHMS